MTIFFQIINNAIKISSEGIFHFELLFLVSIVVYQVIHSIRVSLKILYFKDVFKYSFVVKYGFIEKDKLNTNDDVLQHSFCRQ